MKKFLRFEPQTDKSLASIYPDYTHWISNNEDDEIGAIVRKRLWRKERVAYLTTCEGIYLTSACLRQIADFVDSQEKGKRDAKD
jgi:hypothetical protein